MQGHLSVRPDAHAAADRPPRAPIRRYAALAMYGVTAGIWSSFFALDGALPAAIPIALVLAALGAFSWQRPDAGGRVLVAVAVALAVFWFYMVVVQMDRAIDVSLRYLIIPELFIALPPAISGLILISEGRPA